jgi:hypothetical protein
MLIFDHKESPGERGMSPQTPDGNTAFQAYLRQHHLEALDAAIKSGVRYLVVWNILHNHPVTSAQAAQVRAGLQRVTGIAYEGPIAIRAK